MIHRSGACYRGCVEQAPKSEGEHQQLLFATMAVVADDHVCERIEAAIDEPESAAAAIWGGRVVGRRRAIDACVRRVGDDGLAARVPKRCA